MNADIIFESQKVRRRGLRMAPPSPEESPWSIDSPTRSRTGRVYGLKPNSTLWNQSTDIKSATRLMEYYGPTGKWWRRTIEEPGKINPTK